MTDARRRGRRASTAGGRSRSRRRRAATFRVRFVASDAEAYDRFYNIFANPMLWFIQHYLWDLSNAPDIRRHEVEAFEFGYNVVNEDLADGRARGDRGPGRAGRDGPRLPPLHAARRWSGEARPDVVPAPLRPHPVDAAGRLARAARRKIREEIYRGLLANDIIGFHTRSYRRNFLQCCRDLLDLEVDMERGRRALRRPRGVGARLPAADRLRGDARRSPRATAGARVRGAGAARAGASTRSCASTARTCPRTSCAASPASTSSSSSTRSSPSGSRSPRS